MKIIRNFVSPFFVLLLFLNHVSAETIYRWTDSKGNVKFSTNKGSENAVVAKLPEIKREKFSLNEKKINKAKIISCMEHGGISCAAGADQDGSVICMNGFRGATAPFRFSCTESWLRIDQVTKSKDGKSVEVFIRNDSPAAAKQVQVSYKKDSAAVITGQGVNMIDANGLEKYIFKDNVLAEEKYFTVKCENCR